MTTQQVNGLSSILNQLSGSIAQLRQYYGLLKNLNPEYTLSSEDKPLLLGLLTQWPRFTLADLDWVLPLIDTLQSD